MPKIINRTEEAVHIGNIEPHPANPNDGDVAAIAESIRQNGFYGRVVVRNSTGKILAGEHRWRAAQEVGLAEIPIERVECDDETAMRILLADNRTAEKAEREPEPLADLLQELEQTDDGLTGTGYMGDDLDELLDDLGQIPGSEVEGLSEKPLEEKAIQDLSILNLYAGIGRNRKLWGDGPDVTAVEYNEAIANAYQDHFPKDEVIVADAHEYLLQHFDEFDFIWSSPPCPTHSKLRKNFSVPNGADVEYPDMRLYEEVLLLQGYFEGRWVVENVDPWYDPLIEPQRSDRHIFWANFTIPSIEDIERNAVLTAEEFDAEAHEKSFGYDLSDYGFPSSYPKEKVLKNMVHPKVGKAILEAGLECELIE